MKKGDKLYFLDYGIVTFVSERVFKDYYGNDYSIYDCLTSTGILVSYKPNQLQKLFCDVLPLKGKQLSIFDLEEVK